MLFEVRFRITPEGAFGLPEGTRLVVPAGEGLQVRSDTLHTASLTKVEHGTLPEYRLEKDRIDLELSLPSCSGSIRDNYVVLSVEADSPGAALNTALSDLDLFFRLVSVEMGRVFFEEAITLELADGSKQFPIPRMIELGSFTMYNLDEFRIGLDRAATATSLVDESLDRALSYYEHALLLWEKRAQLSPMMTDHYHRVMGSVYLNLWKACTSLLGDPARPTDGYQSRYRDLGLDELFKAKLDCLKDLRDDFDVAHHARRDLDTDIIEAQFGEAKETARAAIRAYIARRDQIHQSSTQLR